MHIIYYFVKGYLCYASYDYDYILKLSELSNVHCFNVPDKIKKFMLECKINPEGEVIFYTIHVETDLELSKKRAEIIHYSCDSLKFDLELYKSNKWDKNLTENELNEIKENSTNININIYDKFGEEKGVYVSKNGNLTIIGIERPFPYKNPSSRWYKTVLIEDIEIE